MMWQICKLFSEASDKIKKNKNFDLHVGNKLWMSLDIMLQFVIALEIALAKRHNTIMECLFLCLFSSYLGQVQEMPFLIPGSVEKSADVSFSNFSSGKGLVIDIASTCSLQPKLFQNSLIFQGYACNEFSQTVKVKNFGKKFTSEGCIDEAYYMIKLLQMF